MDAFHKSLCHAWVKGIITEDEFYDALQWLNDWEESSGSYRDGL